MALPLMSEEAPAPERPAGAPASAGPGDPDEALPEAGDGDRVNILVVDDRPDKILVLRTVLEELHENIVVAHSGDEALRHLLEYDFAVILLDVNMPGMDGLETAAFIRQRRRTALTPIIFVTAYADEMHTATGYSLGAVDYILAPIMPDILRSKVKVFVQLHRMTRQIQRQAAERVALAREQGARAAAEQASARFSFLTELSDRMEQSIDLGARGQAFARFVVPFLADLAALILTDENGQIRHTELAWLAPTGQAQQESATVETILSEPFTRAIAQVLESGAAHTDERLPEVAASLRVHYAGKADGNVAIGFSPQRLAAFPLRARGRTQGVLLLGFAPGRACDPTGFSFCNDVAGRAAVMLDNARLFETVREADLRKNEFLAMLGHELRNPMAPIRSAVHFLRNPALDETKRRWGLDIIDRQVSQLARLVDDLLDVSRITLGKIELQRETLDLTRVITAAVETSRPLIDARKHQLTVTTPPSSVWVHGDFARLTQVLANLLNNAAKYTEPGGRIEVELQPVTDAQVQLRVRDSGIGITPDNMRRIFDLFMQVEQQVDRAQGGLGIGLTLVRRLVQLHDGRVEVASGGQNQGTEFSVYLPALPAAPPAAMNAAPIQAESAAAAVRVLVVDDNVDSADAMVMSLQLDDYHAEAAYDGTSAIERALAFRPHAVLLDIGLPGMSGLDVARTLRARAETKDMLLIALSGYGQAEDRKRSLDAGLDHHLTKPVDPEALHGLFASLRTRLT